MAYRGNIARIPLGSRGLLTDLSPTQLPPDALLRANNITLENGVLQKAPGARKYNASALPAAVIAGVDWRPNSITQQMIVACSNGSIYKDIGVGTFGGNTAIASGLVNLTPNSMFIQGGNESAGEPKKLFFLSFGENQVKVLNAAGTGFSNIASPATDWTSSNYPKTGVIHRNRLFLFSGQNFYASDTADHENFTTNYLVGTVYPGEGDDIRGAYVFKGRLFAFKDGGFSYWLNDEDPDSDNWYWQKLASNFGLASPHSVKEALDDMYAGNTTGTLTSYKATQAFGDIESADVFRNAKVENYIRNNTNKVGLKEQHCLYYPEKKQFYMTYRSGYYTYNDMLLVLDMSAQEVGPRPLFQIKGSPNFLSLRQDINGIERPFYGDKDGYVMLMDQEDRLEGSTAYRGEFQTIHFDMGHLDPSLAGLNKHFDFLSVSYLPESTGDLSCDYYVDGKYIETLSFPMTQYTETQLDEFTLDTDRLAQENAETFTLPLSGMGRTIGFKFYNAGSNESFQVTAIAIRFRPASNQAQRT